MRCADGTPARRTRPSINATPELCPIQYVPLGRHVKDWNSSRSGASRRIVNAAEQSRIFLDFLQLLRSLDQKFKPCEIQFLTYCFNLCSPRQSITLSPYLTGSHRGRASQHSCRGLGAGGVRDGVHAGHGRGRETDRRLCLLQGGDWWGNVSI